MSRVRVHNFSISLDGFATGVDLALDAPFGHAGHRLHGWLFVTRFAHREILGQPGGASAPVPGAPHGQRHRASTATRASTCATSSDATEKIRLASGGAT